MNKLINNKPKKLNKKKLKISVLETTMTQFKLWNYSIKKFTYSYSLATIFSVNWRIIFFFTFIHNFFSIMKDKHHYHTSTFIKSSNIKTFKHATEKLSHNSLILGNIIY